MKAVGVDEVTDAVLSIFHAGAAKNVKRTK